MDRLLILFIISALSVPLCAINCYENGARKNCQGGNYCATQTVIGTSKVSQFCGNKMNMDNIDICQKAGNNDFNQFANTQTWCCTGDYCNSSKTVGTFFTFIVSCIAVLFTKV